MSHDLSGIELEAYKRANKRPKELRRTPALYQTTAGLLLIHWDRFGWKGTWLPRPVKLKIRKSDSEGR